MIYNKEDKMKKTILFTGLLLLSTLLTACYNSVFYNNVKKADSEFDGNLRFIKWENGELLPINENDLGKMKESDRWFARKFSGSDRKLIDKVLELSK